MNNLNYTLGWQNSYIYESLNKQLTSTIYFIVDNKECVIVLIPSKK